MECSVSDLVKRGHEQAAELKSSCGAIDVRSVAQLISDLASQLEVQLVRGNEQAVQLANAESKCRELAADNAGLKAFKTAVYQQMGAGCEAPEFSITEGLSNLLRFADTLHAIEREFFTKEVPDEECKGETVEECPLPESKEEFNFQIERWIQRLIDRVIRYADEFKEQPVPVVPEEMNFSTACNFVQINGMAKEDRATLAMRAWNACRAAMLNGGKS
ncbi:hypothetical protein [Salmonella enterica]|uniref:hypothetical protein n=1 Tax=Salmonella enterica TaxID=28901 RepID=UPI000A3F1273|nr:hypothetical protein [Salmonella enterica]